MSLKMQWTINKDSDEILKNVIVEFYYIKT